MAIDKTLGIDLSGLEFNAPEEAIVLGERFLYRPGDNPKPGKEKNRQGKEVMHCGHMPIQGIIVKEETYSHPTFQEFNMISILLTKPTVAIDRDHFVRAEPGKTIVVTETADLRMFSAPAAHPTKTVEVYLRPTDKMVDLGDGKSMRLWEKKLVQMIDRSKVNLPNLPAFDGELPPELRA